MIQFDVIIIGGGAAGLLAAGQAASKGAKVLILEKMTQSGRKLSITGKGRCNLTNTAPVAEFINKFGSNGKFLRQAFARFFSDDLIKFLNRLGVETNIERGGRVFPVNNDAKKVVKALVQWVKDSGVTIWNDTEVAKLLVKNNKVIGLKLKDDRSLKCSKVIVATGGASYPATGSTGAGYRLAGSVGHTIVPIRPALVPLITKGNLAKKLQGLSLKNVSVKVIIDGKKRGEEFGEMLFTHFGLSGPIILTISKLVVDALHDKKKVEVSIDLKPALDDSKLDARLLRDFKEHGKQEFHSILKGLLPKKMIPVCIAEVGIKPDTTGNHITAIERKRLRLWLKGLSLTVIDHRSFYEAVITAGGVSTKEINPKTMESKIVKGLFFAGEVIDFDGETGGYNLQAAFSTGWLAGNNTGKHAG